jgi:hypothetical protein
MVVKYDLHILETHVMPADKWPDHLPHSSHNTYHYWRRKVRQPLNKKVRRSHRHNQNYMTHIHHLH